MKQPLLVNLMARFGTIVGRVYKGLMQPKTRITKDRSAVPSKPSVSFFGEYERIEEAKFHTPSTEEGVPLEPGDLPDSYGITADGPIGFGEKSRQRRAERLWSGSGATAGELVVFDSMTQNVIAATKDKRTFGLKD